LKTLIINDPVYLEEILLIVNCSADKLNKYLHKKYGVNKNAVNNPDWSASYLRITNDEDKSLFIRVVWVRDFDWTINDQASLNHELIHCATAILKDKGIDISNDNDEVLAYYHSYLLKTCMIKLKPKYEERKQ